MLQICPEGWLIWLATGLLCASIVHVAHQAYFSDLRKIPGPRLAKFSTLYRILMVRQGHAPMEYRRLHSQYGHIVRTGPKHVSVSDPDMIPVIYGIGSKFKKTPFYMTMAPIYEGSRMDSLFTERDPQTHKALKTQVAQVFSMTNMRNFETYADECTKIFMDSMLDPDGQVIDFAQWLQWYAFDVIGSITFQRRFGFLEERRDVDSMIQKINNGLEYVKVIGQSEWLVALFDVLSTLQWIKSMHLWPDTMERFLEITESELVQYDCESKDPTRTDFLSQLRAKQLNSGKISSRDMMNHLSNNLLAGSDTTGISLRAVFYYVIRDSRVSTKLVSEIDTADAKGKLSEFVTYNESLELPYLQAVLKEAMRMHPAVGFPLERYTPAEGAEICGYSLPPGINVSISAPVIHLNKEVFGEDAEHFRPERWIEANQEQLKTMNRSFLAFGHGTRTCIGKNISLMEMGKFVPQIFRHFQIEWKAPSPEWNLHAAWFWKQSDMLVSLTSRVRKQDEIEILS